MHLLFIILYTKKLHKHTCILKGIRDNNKNLINNIDEHMCILKGIRDKYKQNLTKNIVQFLLFEIVFQDSCEI